MFKTIFYKDKNGNEPIKDFLNELKEKSVSNKNDRIQFEKINTYIKSLQIYGTRIGKPILKHINGGLWELRPLANRIFFFYWKDDTFVFLHHFIKKTQKTPTREIDKARNNLKDFLERNDDK